MSHSLSLPLRTLLLCLCVCLLLGTATAFSLPASAQPRSLPDESPPPKVVYLTFDDGPGPHTNDLLAVLAELDVRATFFLIGRAVKVYPASARAIYEAGHAIGSHSYSHAKESLRVAGAFMREMRKFDEVLTEALGEPLEVRLFRFPYGSRWATDALRREVSAKGYLWIDWNALNEDANRAYNRDRNKMMARAIATSGNRDEIVFLMHEGKQRTLDMLPELVAYFRERGYVFDVLSPQLDHRIAGVNMGLPRATTSPAPTPLPSPSPR